MSRSPGSTTSQESRDAYVAGWEAAFRLLREGRSWSGNERHNVFLNCGGDRFADAASVTGLDFADDGRALAVVDWDGDGDLDLWLHNRSGPRLRLMLNRSERHERAGTAVALRLHGTRTNRDGIGARVELRLRNRPQSILAETLHAGDAFLSQSSKWLHFGLGRGAEIDEVRVRWPGGGSESFSGVRPGGRFVLEEGRGEAVAEDRQANASRLGTAEAKPSGPRAPATPGARLFLPRPVPLPALAFADDEEPGTERSVATGEQPLLLQLWASWCLPCITELEELTRRAAQVEAAGLDVLVLSVDGLDPEQETTLADARRRLEKVGFPFRSGLATPRLLEKIELVESFVYDRRFPFGVPVSYLLDRQGRLAAVWRGPVDLDVLLEDVAGLDGTIQQLHERSAPLPGRWQAPLPELDLVWMASHFKERFPDDAGRYLELAIERGDDGERTAVALFELAELAHREGAAERAISLLRRSVELDPSSVVAHKNLAGLLRQAGRPEEALVHYKVLLELAPDDAEMRYGLGMTLLDVRDVANAFGHLEIASRLDPLAPEPVLARIGILLTYSDPSDPRPLAEAVRLGEQGAEASGWEDPRWLDALAAAYAAAGRFADAARTARDALRLAEAAGDDELASGLAARLPFYARGELP